MEESPRSTMEIIRDFFIAICDNLGSAVGNGLTNWFPFKFEDTSLAAF